MEVEIFSQVGVLIIFSTFEYLSAKKSNSFVVKVTASYILNNPLSVLLPVFSNVFVPTLTIGFSPEEISQKSSQKSVSLSSVYIVG